MAGGASITGTGDGDRSDSADGKKEGILQPDMLLLLRDIDKLLLARLGEALSPGPTSEAQLVLSPAQLAPPQVLRV